MQLDAPGLRTIEVDGQQLYVPSADAWAALWKDPMLGNLKLPVPDLLKKKVQAIARYPEITGALGFAFKRVHYYELLCINDALYRVFIEAVICDHCGYRAVISATPGVADIYWGSQNEAAARERSCSLPLVCCSACKRPLSRRATVWQVNEGV